MSQAKEVNDFQKMLKINELIKLNDDSPKVLKETVSDFSNEVLVDSKSKISSLIELCENIMSAQKKKELLLSGIGKSISKLVALVEIMKSIHPYLIQSSVLTTSSNESDKEGKKEETNKKGDVFLKLEITLSEKEPEGKINEKITEEKKEELMNLWEGVKGIKINNNNNGIKMNSNVNDVNKGLGLNKRRNIPDNNIRNGFSRQWKYGNNVNRWQNNRYGNYCYYGNWNGRYYNINRNNVNNRRFPMYY